VENESVKIKEKYLLKCEKSTTIVFVDSRNELGAAKD
jgi:ribosomal protein L7Ae-like RNA K-turn-binding protein